MSEELINDLHFLISDFWAWLPTILILVFYLLKFLKNFFVLIYNFFKFKKDEF
jgi:hypothetical protein